MSINIPNHFKEILKRDSDIQGNVAHLCSNAAGLFTLNPDFFPDYTFHGMDHINEVLDHADHLIPEKTRNILAPRDIAFLVSAIVIHDLGMFLAEDGVRRLVAGDLRQQHLEGFEDDTWEKAWENYTDRVKRYTQEKMRHLFGGNITVDPDCVKKQPIDSGNDRRVIGEFLRQEHPRLAHEIAVNFFPGDKETYVFKNTSFDETDRDMIGLLARSHGMAIRDTEGYCEENHEEGPKPCNIPIFYLMAVLRIADLLDAGSHRAPNIRLDAKRIRIPISVEEWTWNQRITPKKCKWDVEKGKRHIFADPTTSIEYVQLDRWLSQLQGELDLSWSVLSEKYPTEDYRLSIHRVTSNIREAGARKKMDEKFLTQEAKVTANPEIVKLLMEPLYGDDPSYGVRELLQNAVDACIEREEKERSGYEGKVIIRVDEEFFSIEDNGIGMDENVLLNYYLSAGSSYRDSDEWKRDFTENGESRIARTGRFGVGFLAAFLLGDEITVHTQHLQDNKGYLFSFGQDSRPLNIRREKRPEGTGTTITIRLKAGIHDRLQNDRSWYMWYILDDPKVTYYLDGKERHPQYQLIPRNPVDPDPWVRLETENFENYLWKFPYHNVFDSFREEPKLSCNGIRIENHPSRIGRSCGIEFDAPCISLLDPHNHLQIDLARKKVLSFPDEKQLTKEIYRYIIAGVLVLPHTWDHRELCRIPTQHYSVCLQRSRSFLPCHPAFLSAAGVNRYLNVCCLVDKDEDRPQYIKEFIAPDFLTSDIPLLILTVPKDEPSEKDLFHHETILRECLRDMFRGNHTEIAHNLYSCRNLWIPNELFISHNLGALSFLSAPDCQEGANVCKWSFPNLLEEHELWQAAALKEDGLYKSNKSWQEMYSRYETPINPAKFTANKYGFAADFIASDNFLDAEPTLFSETLHEYLGDDIWIPIDMEERKKKFPKAFKELAFHMEYLRKHPGI